MVVDLFLVYQFIRRLATPFENWDAYKLGIIDKDGKVLKKRKTLKTKKEEQAWGLYDIMLANIKKLLAKVPGGSTKLASYAAALFLIKEYKHFTDDSLITEDMDESDIDNILVEFQTRYGYYNTLAENVNSFDELIEAKVRWKKAGPNGEIQATIGGKKYQIEKSLDHNERHKGEWKVMVWDRGDWQWETTEYGKANAKEWIMDRMEEDVSVGSGSIAGLGVGPDGEPGVTPAQAKRYKKKNKSKLLSFKEKMKND